MVSGAGTGKYGVVKNSPATAGSIKNGCILPFHEHRMPITEGQPQTSSESTIFCSGTEKTMAKRRISLTGM